MCARLRSSVSCSPRRRRTTIPTAITTETVGSLVRYQGIRVLFCMAVFLGTIVRTVGPSGQVSIDSLANFVSRVFMHRRDHSRLFKAGEVHTSCVNAIHRGVLAVKRILRSLLSEIVCSVINIFTAGGAQAARPRCKARARARRSRGWRDGSRRRFTGWRGIAWT